MTQTIQAALFPIPDMVTFPGTVVPLHVFEPRYRAMINHCLEHQLPLAVSHTRKAISKPKAAASPQQALQQNQTSYEACDVFSAGTCQLIKTTDDGRMYIEVNMHMRLRKTATSQQVPFQVVECIELQDQPEDLDDADYQAMINDIRQLLEIISERHNEDLKNIMDTPDWHRMTPAEFSFSLFRHIRFEASYMQQILEQTQLSERLKMIWLGLSQAV